MKGRRNLQGYVAFAVVRRVKLTTQRCNIDLMKPERDGLLTREGLSGTALVTSVLPLETIGSRNSSPPYGVQGLPFVKWNLDNVRLCHRLYAASTEDENNSPRSSCKP